MADVNSKEIRSFNMSKIKGKDTKPELLVRKVLYTEGFRYRLHVKNLLGKPRYCITKIQDSDFCSWMFLAGHQDCKYYVIPKTRTEWRVAKINENIINDQSSKDLLTSLGLKVLDVWECKLNSKTIDQTFNSLLYHFIK
ncbi:very short patch repair endonuclease [Pedobacter panaciterrae]|uniref:very short patch repair endonuclease n=1 Tax=Pedobacter panaciterrae TaxID=363849 RepID=UPI002597891E|nr:very short patch repair endonuclease [uncultured Pedobacter sp.]